MDCHEDAQIRVTGSDETGSGHAPPPNFFGQLCRLESEIEPSFGFQVEAEDVHIRGVSTTPGQRLQGIRISVGHLGLLRLKRVYGSKVPAVAPPSSALAGVLFRLSSLSYGLPHCIQTADYLGNRQIEVLGVRTLKMHRSTGAVELVLHKHWAWHEGKLKRLIAASFPVLEIKDASCFQWGQIEEIQQIGRDACLLLTLAARHLVVAHVMVATAVEHQLEEWTYPLNRQRSTTEEEATGPFIDERELEGYFSCASAQWLRLTDDQRDTVRSAIFSIHPFVQTSSEGAFLQMFAALEGLATTWFPTGGTFAQRIAALLAAYPPRVGGLWPITTTNKDGLYAIRNQLAHGSGMQGAKQEALLVATDHLQVWIEHILLAVLGYSRKQSPRDWLSKHVRDQLSDLPRLQAAIRS
jgi:hypothetical protein